MTQPIICGEMSQSQKKIFQLFGNLAGEMRIDDIPTAPSVNIDELKKGDSDPLEVVVEIPASKSKRGWNYKGQSLQDIVTAVNSSTLNGFLGHQKPEDVSNQFLPPVTHWVGAKMVGEIAYFRGVVDSSATDLKRWIRSGRIKQVSIFGRPKLQRSGRETNVIGYEPMSIDWTPLDRAGMNTRIVAMSGEMWDLEGEGPSGEMNGNEGGRTMNPEEVLAALKTMLGNKQITVPMIAGEMGWKPEEVASDIDKDWAAGVTASVAKLQEVEKALGISGEMDVVQVAKDAANAIKAQEAVKFDKMVGEMVDEKVKSEAVRKELYDPKTALGKMWGYHSSGFSAEKTKEELAGEMDSFLADEVVKGLISNHHTDKPAGTGGGQPPSKTTFKTKRVSL
ncbi:hypothetical protein HMPREF9372_3362 [Sporosarcina newyorkensis 2681]|uniref:Uncharacterized protein n=1 Tax=Sporosarcina newyorkensis 2681 TaxID=1027292 RepID=F9DX31_9BACL|nr:hypothetical protein [Sporosarcina newyorkensis]EGQ21079.1 hypothetical protein HMPREF9372_3362 [Sporosarcina newyorkensis 2681]